MLKIHYQGLLRSTASWAHVNRQLILHLDRAGGDLSVTNCKGFLYDPGFRLPARLQELLNKPRNRDVEIALEYPRNYHRIKGRLRVGILFYESTVLPPAWAAGVRTGLDRLVVPSTFCRGIMLEAGIPADMVSVVPYGADRSLFHPAIPPKDLGTGGRFTFLHIAAPHKRKGTADLIRAYIAAFGHREEVALVLKTSYTPRCRPWETPALEQLVQQERGRADGVPLIKIINRPEPDARIASYLTACDAYIQPSYSEGFGLVILEAMACAKPVITTGWSAPLDYCTPENSFLLAYTLIPAGDMQYDYPEGKGQVARPDFDHLVETLREVFDNRPLRETKGKQAYQDTGEMTWENSARQLLGIVTLGI